MGFVDGLRVGWGGCARRVVAIDHQDQQQCGKLLGDQQGQWVLWWRRPAGGAD